MKVCDFLRCDFCMKEGMAGSNWYENWNGFFYIPGDDGINGGFKGEHLCPTCRTKINRALAILYKENQSEQNKSTT